MFDSIRKAIGLNDYKIGDHVNNFNITSVDEYGWKQFDDTKSSGLNDYKIGGDVNNFNITSVDQDGSKQFDDTTSSRPLGYKTSLNEWRNFTSKEVCQIVFGRIITGVSYTARHWELAKNAQTYKAAVAHRVLGLFELIPIAGSVVAVVERFLLEKPSDTEKGDPSKNKIQN